MKTVLFEQESAGLAVTVTLYLQPEGQLVMEGYDRGEVVKNLKGNWDYEYSISLEPKQVSQLATFLQISPDQPELLFQVVKDRFGGEEGLTRFKTFLQEHHIPYDWITW